MEQEEKPKKHGGVTNYFQGATIHNLVINGNMTKNGSEYFNGEKRKIAGVTPQVVSSALSRCDGYLWGSAAYTVAFCVCRDSYEGWTDNATDFERKMRDQGIDLADGTINTALFHNPYMKFDISKWVDLGAMDRVIKLRDEFSQQVNIILQKNKKAV